MTVAEISSKMMATLESMSDNLQNVYDEATGSSDDAKEVRDDVDSAVDNENTDKDGIDPLSSEGFKAIMEELVSDDDEEGAKALTTTQTEAIRIVALDYAGIEEGTTFDSITDDTKKDKFKEALAMLATGYNGDDNTLSLEEFGTLAAEAIVVTTPAQGS